MVDAASNDRSLIGERISVIGGSCSGKSTFAEHLAGLIDGTYVELDALYWLPDWEGRPVDEFRSHVTAVLEGAPRWAVSGNYFGHRIPEITWARADTLIWLDLPLRTTLPRLLRRSWGRWRSNELLWGTNRENFFRHLKLWDPTESLIAYTLQHAAEKGRRDAAALKDPKWAHLRKYRLRSSRAIESFLATADREATGAPRLEGARG